MRALVLSLLLLVAPAGHAAEDCADLSAQPIVQGVLWEDVWDAMQSTSSCTQNCHLGSAPAAGLDLSNRQLSIYFLVGQLSGQSGDIELVVPGDPQASLLYQKIACASPDVGRPMPPPSGQAPPALQALIHDWIEQGALGESAIDPIPRDFLFRDALESTRSPPPGASANAQACEGIYCSWRAWPP